MTQRPVAFFGYHVISFSREHERHNRININKWQLFPLRPETSGNYLRFIARIVNRDRDLLNALGVYKNRMCREGMDNISV